MARQPEDLVWSEPQTLSQGGYPGLNARTVNTHGMVIHYDTVIPMRDGRLPDRPRSTRGGPWKASSRWPPTTSG